MKERAGERPVERSAACGTCGKTFARSDTLLRHEKNHHATEDRGPVHRVTNGTFRACHACATARSRCSGGVPCGRCNVRKIECVYPNKRRKGLSPEEPSKAESEGSKQQLLGHFSQFVFAANDHAQLSPTSEPDTRKPSSSNPIPETVAHPIQPDSYAPPNFSPAFVSRNPSAHHGNQEPLEMNTMASGSGALIHQDHFNTAPPMTTQYDPGFVGAASNFDYASFDEPLNWIPPSIYPSPYDAELEQDFSFILPTLSNTPNLGADYSMAIPLDSTAQIYQVPTNISQEMSENQGFPASLMALEPSPASSASDGVNMTKSTHSASTASDLKRKRRKPSFVPDIFNKPRKQRTGYAFPETPDHSTSISSTENVECSPLAFDSILNAFRKLCVEKALRSPFETSMFPDLGILNACINLYFDNFHPNFPLLHKASFGPQSHWILVLAVVAIGSTFTKAPYALDLRESFQELLRRAVEQYADGTPDLSLDLPLAQARILNLIGLVQSDREQLRALAPRYHADLSRWCLESGILQLPESGDQLESRFGGENLDHRWELWQNWIRIESLRRVGYLAWMLDCCLGYMANARPLCNMDDARTPLPCSESAWTASNPESWAEAARKLPQTPSLCAALETLYNKKKVDPTYSELSQALLIHALYQRTWEVGTHIKQPLSEWVPTGKARGFLNTPSKDNFWLPLYPLYANWRNSACDCLDVLHWQASSIVAKASGVEHGVILHLHLARIILLTPFQEIQDLLFSLIGKVGTSSKASFYVHDGSYQPRNSAKLPQIRKITWRWLREDQHKARLAMVHAGSVFWYVRRYSATSFFEPIAVYLATLVLWTYGSYKSAALERDAAAANQKPEGGPSGPDAVAAIQPSRMERKEHPVKFISKAAAHPENGSGPMRPQTNTPTSGSPLAKSSSDRSKSLGSNPRAGGVHHNSSPHPSRGDSDSDSEDSSGSRFSSSDEQPEFIHLDRPCDDEMVQHFVRNGHNMSGHMSNVGDICKTPQKVLLEGAKLLRTRLACWGVSREYYDILTKLAELRKAG